MKTLKQIQNAQLHLPVVVALELDHYAELYKISIFPAFCSVDRHPTIHQVLAEYFDEDKTYTLPVVGTGNIYQLSIYLVDSCDMPSIQVLMKNMSVTFPEVSTLTFCFENPCRCKIVSFLLTMIILELTSIRVISAITGDEENCLFIPRAG